MAVIRIEQKASLWILGLFIVGPAGLGIAIGCGSSSALTTTGVPDGRVTQDQILRGRSLVTSSACTDCHNRGNDDPGDPKWLAGFIGPAAAQGPGAFQVGPFHTYAANLTPDTTTGIGRFTERQIFNALRYGLSPDDSPDAVITGTTPGQGNFPAAPHYLAPPMPWPSFRQKPDADLWAIVAYLKHGIKAVINVAPDSQSPPDHWANNYTPDKTGPSPLPSYPASNEQFVP